jgi:HJR/Mrr/RecB family endonuclease
MNSAKPRFLQCALGLFLAIVSLVLTGVATAACGSSSVQGGAQPALDAGTFTPSDAASGAQDATVNPQDAAADAAVPVGLTGAQEAYVKASNTHLGSVFGQTVALSADGNTMAVGAPAESSAAKGINGNQADTSASGAGAVYIFSRVGATWAQQAYLKASNTRTNAAFGASVALSADGNTLAVGSYQESSAAKGLNGNQADTSAASAGAVYIFSRVGVTWSQPAYLKASNTRAAAQFGDSVALSADGNTLAVGSSRESSAATGIDGDQAGTSAPNAGAVYVFSRAGATWSQQTYVKASNTRATGLFGYSVALSANGSTLAVGSLGESSAATGINGNQADVSAGTYAGAVYVLSRVGTTWSQQAYVKASNARGAARFGESVALSADGNTLAVGSSWESSAATGIDGDQALNAAFNSAGAVYVFSRAAATWAQQAYVKASNPRADALFGYTVTLRGDGNTLAVGSLGESSAATGLNGNQADTSAASAGAVYVFSRAGPWAQQAYVKASNTRASAQFGSSVALSTDGHTLAVGSFFELSAATGINGNQADTSASAAGAVYVFR